MAFRATKKISLFIFIPCYHLTGSFFPLIKRQPLFLILFFPVITANRANLFQFADELFFFTFVGDVKTVRRSFLFLFLFFISAICLFVNVPMNCYWFDPFGVAGVFLRFYGGLSSAVTCIESLRDSNWEKNCGLSTLPPRVKVQYPFAKLIHFEEHY